MGRKKGSTLQKNNDSELWNETESMYSKIDEFRSNEFERKCKKALIDGKYSSLEEARANVPSVSIGACVRATVMKHSTSKEPLANKMLALDTIIRDIMGVTPLYYYTHYCTALNKRYNLYNLINQIVEQAPDIIKVEACFDAKNILFRFVYPDLYNSKIKDMDSQVKGREIFYCDENIKSGLCRAGNTEKQISTKSFKAYGDQVDEVIMGAIEDVIFDDLDLDDAKDIFMFLAEESAYYYDNSVQRKAVSPNQIINNKPAGINQVIEKRGYTSLLDFYYLNCDKTFQEKYCREFYEVRNLVKDYLPKNDLLEKAVLSMNIRKEMTDVSVKKNEEYLPEDLEEDKEM